MKRRELEGVKGNELGSHTAPVVTTHNTTVTGFVRSFIFLLNLI